MRDDCRLVDSLMSGTSGTLQTSVGLEVKVERKGVRDRRVDNGTGGKVTGTVHVLLVDSKEAHVVALGADDEGDLGTIRLVNRATTRKDSIKFRTTCQLLQSGDAILRAAEIGLTWHSDHTGLPRHHHGT